MVMAIHTLDLCFNEGADGFCDGFVDIEDLEKKMVTIYYKKNIKEHYRTR